MVNFVVDIIIGSIFVIFIVNLSCYVIMIFNKVFYKYFNILVCNVRFNKCL